MFVYWAIVEPLDDSSRWRRTRFPAVVPTVPSAVPVDLWCDDGDLSVRGHLKRAAGEGMA